MPGAAVHWTLVFTGASLEHLAERISRRRTLLMPPTVGRGGHVYVERAGALGNVGS